jgi:hypothetical protein
MEPTRGDILSRAAHSQRYPDEREQRRQLGGAPPKV